MVTKKRTYEETHPWLTFELDLKRASTSLWIMLGECQSKCEHISGVPLTLEAQHLLYQIYLAKGVHATTAIEGNTLSEEQVREQIEGKLELPPSRQYQAQETKNIIDECDRILKIIKDGKPLALTSDRIKELNGVVLNGLELEEEVVPGEIRKHSVGIFRYRGAPAEDCEYLIDLLCERLGSSEFNPLPDMPIANAILRAVTAHLYLAWIHPFGDGNGRTARLVEFQILMASGVPAPAAQLLSNHYNQTRDEYYRQLDHASLSKGNVEPFFLYAVQGYRDGLVEQLKVIQKQQFNVAWENYIHYSFKDKTGIVNKRRKQLILELSAAGDRSVMINKLLDTLPRLTKPYANKSKMTISRDINVLIKMGLVIKSGNLIRACKEQILAFLPPKADSEDSC